MERSHAAYAAWKEADALARDREAKLAQTWERYEAKAGKPPTAELLREVSTLRALANDKLTVALHEIRDVKR